MPANVNKISNIQDLSVSFLKIAVTDNPHVRYCVHIRTSLEYKIWFMGEEIAPSDVVPKPPAKVTSVSFLKTLLSNLDQRKEKQKTTEEKVNEIITMLDHLPIKNRKLAFIQELLNIVCAHANDLWRFIKNNSRLRAAIISSTNSRSIFTNHICFHSVVEEIFFFNFQNPATSSILMLINTMMQRDCG